MEPAPGGHTAVQRSGCCVQQLSLHLAENLAELDARFGASADYYAKEIMIYHCRGCIVLFDGMASLDSLWELLLLSLIHI